MSELPQKPVFRFAPSPNGALHLGHAYSALLNEQLARKTDGRLLLRIEDIDQTRCTPALEAQMISDLAWLGLDFAPPHRRQSDHFEDYRQALDQLIGRGLAYPAFMSRGDIRAWIGDQERETGKPWPRDPDGAPIYPALDRHLSASAREARIASGEPFAWRLDMEAALAMVGEELSWLETGEGPSGAHDIIAAEPAVWGDVMLARRDTPTSYHLSVVVDDALQGVTDVVRGRDLFFATAIHRLLQHLLSLAAPRYHHHRLILGDDGTKLSKSKGDTGIAALRDAGIDPVTIRIKLGFR
ncbi:tRNA glutamyl-Q(34) synthetase GluQRS [Rhizobium sp. EC-SD404]|uniref:tRNA glutamyl-Q(34) synthetase GluQRS n=1 Tax=Rhizobium sp. EC-SD404 TaxID=2038389 RepID=UPI001252C372|nr:tRNA glutamyl-Q(34) synthetase GluQRS [Rhizobium sp. EC-SD404]VVT29703.1 Glutamyl-Q tRNA(Asp) synthetase [Rhizobium sp. EC-SD404]